MIETITNATAPLSGVGMPWYICGGWAIDLFVGRQTREHKDLDIAIARSDQLDYQRVLLERGWSIQVMEAGTQVPWRPGWYIEPPYHEVWADPPENKGDRIELLLNEIENDVFHFRRDQAMTMPTDQALILDQSGLRYLAPEIVLLYKASNPESPVNQADLQNALSRMPDDRLAWLRRGLQRMDNQHPWLIMSQLHG